MATQVMNCADDISSILFLLGNQKRLEIMSLLMTGEMCVGDIAQAVNLSQSALSQHLAKLRACRLVKTRRDKQTIYYSLGSPVVLQLLETLSLLYSPRPWPERNPETQLQAALH